MLINGQIGTTSKKIELGERMIIIIKNAFFKIKMRKFIKHKMKYTINSFLYIYIYSTLTTSKFVSIIESNICLFLTGTLLPFNLKIIDHIIFAICHSYP